MSFKLGFMGTPDFAAVALKALIDAGYEIAVVYSQPPRPAGRGHHEQKSPVHLLAESHDIPVLTPPSLRTSEAGDVFKSHRLDLAVVAAYGLILPRAILDAPRLGCVNIHASLLPRWRGAAPIQRAIEAGDPETGITIMQMDEGLDTGAMLMKESVPITSSTTAQSLHDELAALGGKMIVKAVESFGELQPIPQPEAGVTYARKLDKSESPLDFSQNAEVLERKIRAFFPWPGTQIEVNGERLKVLAAEVAAGSGAPGTVLDDHLTIACGEGALRLLRLQRPGKAPLDAADFLRGFSLKKGMTIMQSHSPAGGNPDDE